VALQRVPRDDDARRLLAELRLRRVGSVDLDALRTAAESGDAGARLQLGKGLAAAGKYDEALPELLAAVRHPATRDEARTAVLEVFALAGDNSELTRTWRPKLASALF
jgi:thioredoxin-like negative regulator of GroEL